MRTLSVEQFLSSSILPSVVPQPAVHRCGVGPPGVQVSLEQQAYMLLTEPERETMVYYLQEYQEGHIAVQALVMALFELFNTHAKVDLRPPGWITDHCCWVTGDR